MTNSDCILNSSSIPQENWLPVVGWETVYEVSDLGRVRRIKAGKKSRGDRGKIGRLMGIRPDAYNYAQVHLRDWPRDLTIKVHILVALAFLGAPPEGHEVNHKDGNRMNPRLDNLEYLTRGKNLEHAYRVLGRAKVCMKGETNAKAKLSNEQVLDIRRRYIPRKVSQQSLADEFGVTQAMIGFIVRGENWKHI